MKVIRDLSQASVERETVLTIGAFDGLHLGHQSLLKKLMQSAQEAKRLSGVVTFDPLPRTVLTSSCGLLCLTSIEDKIELLQTWGLDILVIVPFTLEVARTSARDFVWPLRDRLRMAELWVGWNFALGRGREGDVPALQKLGQEMGFDVHVVEPVSDGSAVISSTQIRNLLGAGRVSEAAEMLGRYYQFSGVVLPAAASEPQASFVSARLRVERICSLLAGGVYATHVIVQGRPYPGVTNIATEPAYEDDKPTVGIHLPDYEGELTGERIRVQFVERLRDERRFASEKALRAQIKKDMARAREILT